MGDMGTAIAAYVRNDDGHHPGLADLPTRWYQQPCPYRRDLLLWYYVRASLGKRAAWDGLHRLLVTLKGRGEAVPEPLQEWACHVAAGVISPSRENSSPNFANQDDRNDRIEHVYATLIDDGWSTKDAEGEILEALVELLDESTIRKIFRRLKLRERYPEATIAAQ